ncbi:PAS domain-containing protein [Aureimonas sp. AU12]|uniref:PAS domain-containing protein n=1 Tax=Aureimonas sp. AU12 TaxID=1638161 RepID=UPI0007840411|nr:PAS domain-containing protein [Aureimonas sp. AU12]
MHSRSQRSSIAARSAFVGAWKWEPESQRIYADEGMSAFFGVPMQDGLAGLSTLDFRSRIHLDDRARIGPQLVRAADHHLPFSINYRVVTPHQGIRQVRSFGRPLTPRGQTPEYIGAILDMGSGSNDSSPLVEAIDLLISARDQMARADHAILTKLIDAVLMEASRELSRRMDRYLGKD